MVEEARAVMRLLKVVDVSQLAGCLLHFLPKKNE
jgi:hypothetical protein